MIILKIKELKRVFQSGYIQKISGNGPEGAERKKSKKRMSSHSDRGDSPKYMKEIRQPVRKSLPSERSLHRSEIEENPMPEIEADTSVNFGN